MNQEAEAFREVPAFGLNGQAPPQRVTAAPSTPMAVARDVIGDCFRDGSSVLLRHHRGDFYQYDGTCWPQAEDNGIKSQTYKWLEWALFEKETRTGTVLVPWSPTSGKVSNVIDACRALTRLPATVEAPAWIDLGIDGQSGQGGQGNSTLFSARDLIALKNGLLHLPSRKLLSHTPAFFSQNCLPYAYDAAAECPRWLEFLGQLWPEDKQSIATLQEMLGYVVSGDTTQQKIFLILGPRRAGKGTISRVISGMLGKHNVAAPTLAGLASNFDLQELITRPLAIITDARLSSKTDSSLVVERLLSISGEDPQQIDRKYRDPWNGRLPTRLLVLTNELPRLIDSSGALAGRFVLLVLTESFFGREDPALTDELLKEAAGILNWALLGLDRLTKRGHFITPEASHEVAQQMEDLASPMGGIRAELLPGRTLRG